MKILVICQYYYPEPFCISEICEELVRRNHDVTVVTSKPNYGYYKIMGGYEKRDFEVLNGVKVIRENVIPRKGSRISIIKNYLSYFFKARHRVKKIDKDFDVVYSMSLSPVISIDPANRYAKKRKVKHVLHCLDLWPESVSVTGAYKKKSLAYKLIYRWSKKLYNSVDEILVSSPSFKEYFNDYLHISKPISYVPQPMLEYSNTKPFVYDKEYCNIVYCGNIGSLQCVELLIEAMALLKKEKVRLYLIGQGSHKEKVLELIKSLGIEDKVIFLGSKPRSEASAYFYNASLFYLGLEDVSYVGSTIPSKLISYLKYGHPIVASISNDGKKVLESAQGERFITDYTPTSIAEKIKDVMSIAQKEKDEIHQKSIEYFNTHFALDVVVDKVEEALIRNAKK